MDPIHQIDQISQLSIVVAAFAVKPAYMAIAFLLVVLLGHRRERDLSLIRRGLALFFLGEAACAANYLVSGNESRWLEFLHGLGMVGMNGLVAWGFTELLDDRVIHYLDPDRACAFQKLCGTCWKRNHVACALHRVALFLAPAFAIVALIPLTAPLWPDRRVTPVFGTDVLWVRDAFNLAAQFRVYPIVGALGFVAAFGVLLSGQRRLRASLPPFFAAFGFASFSLFRFILEAPFLGNPAWSNWWEESIELVVVIAITVFLWCFRAQLGLRFPRTRPSATLQGSGSIV